MIPPGEEAAARAKIPNIPGSTGVLRANGPILTEKMRVYGVKLGMALHFEAHGEGVPDAGGVQPMLFSNVQAARGELSTELLALLPERKTLQQGKFHVDAQFSYSIGLTEEKRHTYSYAVFRNSFASGAVTALDTKEFLERHARKFPIVRPGDFRT